MQAAEAAVLQPTGCVMNGWDSRLMDITLKRHSSVYVRNRHIWQYMILFRDKGEMHRVEMQDLWMRI